MSIFSNMIPDVNDSIGKLVNILRTEDEYITKELKQSYVDKVAESNGANIINPTKEDMIDIEDSRELINNSIFIRKNSPAIIGLGTSQIVIRLDENSVAKAQYRQKYSDMESIGSYIIGSYEPSRTETERILRIFGIDIPQHTYLINSEYPDIIDKYNFKMSDDIYDRAQFMISKDLTENGKYLVTEYHNEALKTLRNKEQVLKEYDKMFNILNDLRWQNEREYSLSANNHLMSSGNITGAIQHLFLLRIDPRTNIGKLVAEDTNHIDVWKTNKKTNC